MARKEIKMEELVEVLYQWHKGQSIRSIERSIGIDRKTIKKYIDLAVARGATSEHGLSTGCYGMQKSF